MKKNPTYLAIKMNQNHDFRRFIFSILIALVSFRFFVRDLTTMKESVKAGHPTLDTFYATRILRPEFSISPMGNYLIQKTNGSSIEPNPFSLGELLHSLVFQLFSQDVVVSYFAISLIVLIIWIFLFSKLAIIEHKSSAASWITLIILLFTFFSNFSLVGGSYEFQRIISPQLSVVLWLIANLLLVQILSHKPEKSQKRNMVLFALLILVSSCTYTFAFLVILGMWIVILLNQYFAKRFKDMLGFLIGGLVAILPISIAALARRKEDGFIDASLRMGLIESRVPGAFRVIVISVIIFLLVFVLQRKGTPSKQTEIFKNFIILSTSSLLLASQSNVITGVSIQFSDHFDVFAYCNLIIFITYLLSRAKLGGGIYSLHRIKIVSFVILVCFGAFSLVIASREIQLNEKIDTWKRVQKQISGVLNGNGGFIVDSPELSESFPVFSMNPLLYHKDLFYYGVSNSELALRKFVSSGCDPSWNLEENLELFVYLLDAEPQKAERIRTTLSIIGFEEKLDFLYRDLFKNTERRREILQEEVNTAISKVREFSCIEVARQFNVRYILFTKDSNWITIFDEGDKKAVGVFDNIHYLVDLDNVQ